MNDQYIQMLAQAGISEAVIANSFSPATLQRGIKYFESDRVKITDIESSTGEDIKIHADVMGSLGYAYAIVVTLKMTRNYASIVGECDCPVGFRCKHAVATLLKFSADNARAINEKGQLDSVAQGSQAQQEQAELEVEQWLSSLGPGNPILSSVDLAQQPGSQASKTVYNNTLLYLLKPAENEQGMEIVTMLARRLKKGGYGKSRPQSLEDLVDGYTLQINFEHYDLDIEIAGLLYSMTGKGLFYRENVYSLKGDIGELALEKLLKTQRCFWQTQEINQPLQSGSPRMLNLSWEQVDDNYQVVAAVSPGAQELFHLQDFYYLDSQAGQVGRVTHADLSSEQIHQILYAPPVPVGLAEKVSEQLLKTWPENEVPMPVKLGSETIVIAQAPAAADVLVHSIEIETIETDRRKTRQQETRRVHLLSLRFDYGGHLIQPQKPGLTYSYYKEQQYYQINRDRAFEQQCIDTLQHSHFISAHKTGLTRHNKLDYVLDAESATAALWFWHDFQYEVVPELQAQGWHVHFDDTFHMQIEEADTWYGELEEQEGNDWFEISLGIEIEGQTINLLPSLVELLAIEKNPAELRARILAREHVILPVSDDGSAPRWIKLPSTRIMGIFDTLVELYETQPLNDSGNLVFSKHQGLQLGELLNDPALKWKGADELQLLSRKIQDFKGIQSIAPPDNLQTQLRDYQQHGLNWLQFLRDYQFNGILADDMGLGKTVQALAYLLYEKQQAAPEIPSLVVAPTSLMGNWKREAHRFTPDLKVLLLHGPDRKELFSDIGQYDIVLTTYSLMLRDKEFHEQQSYNFVILDESQNIKNARSKTSQVIFHLRSKYRLCMTGTPMENHLGELWSLFHFLMPGYLGTLERFNRLFRTPIEKQADSDRQQQLHQRLKPFMLRRTKEMVATELPKKTEMIRTVPLSGKQRDLYETVRLAMDEKVREEITKKGLARSQIMILDALLKLRQTCCDPRLLSLSRAKEVHTSAKLEMLMEMVPEMVEEGRKILIFSQFVKMLGFIEEELKKHPIQYTKLTGQTRNRDEVIMEFQEGAAQVFLISLKAGGVGLNLTAADTVIHYDPWWNPAVERQATDRAYRIGQDKPVFVYKLLTEETVEEKILSMQQSKQELADALYQDKPAGNSIDNPDAAGAQKSPQFSQHELMELLNPLD